MWTCNHASGWASNESWDIGTSGRGNNNGSEGKGEGVAVDLSREDMQLGAGGVTRLAVPCVATHDSTRGQARRGRERLYQGDAGSQKLRDGRFRSGAMQRVSCAQLRES